MELTADLFSQSLLTLESQAAYFPNEQRFAPRSAMDVQATVIPLTATSGLGTAEVAVRDLSRAGVGFLIDRPMRLDEQFALVLPQSCDTPAVILCAVAFWQPIDASSYAIGGRFIRVLKDSKQGLHIEPSELALELAGAAWRESA
ncbi:MAG TPA: hypothetical protein VFW23_05435 [Tepidisphaeraceae bacterium]|nr:hypothetical protein [Tepidisphaeraceae bacterium]